MPSIEIRYERVLIETDIYRVEGDLTLPQGGYRNAVSDYLNRDNEEFIFLVNVELVVLDGSGRSWNSPTLMLAKRYIRSVSLKGLPDNN